MNNNVAAASSSSTPNLNATPTLNTDGSSVDTSNKTGLKNTASVESSWTNWTNGSLKTAESVPVDINDYILNNGIVPPESNGLGITVDPEEMDLWWELYLTPSNTSNNLNGGNMNGIGNNGVWIDTNGLITD